MAALQPRPTYLLPRVDAVGDLELGNDFLYLLGELRRREARRLDVVRAVTKRLVGDVEKLDDGTETVVDVHHREAGVRSQVACVVAGPQRVVEYLHRVICRPQHNWWIHHVANSMTTIDLIINLGQDVLE